MWKSQETRTILLKGQNMPGVMLLVFRRRGMYGFTSRKRCALSNFKDRKWVTFYLGGKIRAGSHLLPPILSTIVCSGDQNLSTPLFSNATPHLCFFKNFKIGKHQRFRWGWLIFSIFEKTKEPAVKAVNGCQYWLLIETVGSRNAKEPEMSRRDNFYLYYG